MENVSTTSDVQYVIKNIHPTNQAHTLKSTYNILLFSFFISSHPAALQTIEDKQTRSGKPRLTQNLSRLSCQIFRQILAVVVQTNSAK